MSHVLQDYFYQRQYSDLDTALQLTRLKAPFQEPSRESLTPVIDLTILVMTSTVVRLCVGRDLYQEEMMTSSSQRGENFTKKNYSKF